MAICNYGLQLLTYYIIFSMVNNFFLNYTQIKSMYIRLYWYKCKKLHSQIKSSVYFACTDISVYSRVEQQRETVFAPTDETVWEVGGEKGNRDERRHK